ncbi:Protein FAM195B, partial [Acipenser ruthenus]
LFYFSSPASRFVSNGKRNTSPRSPTNTGELFTPAHEENVRFIYDAWQCVLRDLASSSDRSERGPQQYVEKTTNPGLNNVFFNQMFDNYSCWPDSLAGNVMRVPCPLYLPWYERVQSGHVYRRCMENGSWLLLENSSLPCTIIIIMLAYSYEETPEHKLEVHYFTSNGNTMDLYRVQLNRTHSDQCNSNEMNGSISSGDGGYDGYVDQNQSYDPPPPPMSPDDFLPPPPPDMSNSNEMNGSISSGDGGYDGYVDQNQSYDPPPPPMSPDDFLPPPPPDMR